MGPFNASQLPAVARTASRARSVRRFGALLAAALVLVLGAEAPSDAGQQAEGAELFQKHCLACHPGKLKTLTYGDLVDSVRTPPIGMPAFNEQKLSDEQVRAIGDHLYQTASGKQQAGRLEAALAEPKPDPEEAFAETGQERPRRSLKERKAWLRGFGTN